MPWNSYVPCLLGVWPLRLNTQHLLLFSLFAYSLFYVTSEMSIGTLYNLFTHCTIYSHIVQSVWSLSMNWHFSVMTSARRNSIWLIWQDPNGSRRHMRRENDSEKAKLVTDIVLICYFNHFLYQVKSKEGLLQTGMCKLGDKNIIYSVSEETWRIWD